MKTHKIKFMKTHTLMNLNDMNLSCVFRTYTFVLSGRARVLCTCVCARARPWCTCVCCGEGKGRIIIFIMYFLKYNLQLGGDNKGALLPDCSTLAKEYFLQIQFLLYQSTIFTLPKCNLYVVYTVLSSTLYHSLSKYNLYVVYTLLCYILYCVIYYNYTTVQILQYKYLGDNKGGDHP